MKIRFKELVSNQSVLFPSNLLERIAPNHPVLIVNQVVVQLNMDCLLSKYKGGGTSAYHPRMLLKILFYAYLSNIYSCRKIAKALGENIYFMWLSGNSCPDFRTINRFRSEGLKEDIKELFTQLVLLLQEAGYVSLDVQYIDGTKIESASNRYTFVWRGSVENYKSKLEAKIRDVLSLVDKHIEQDKKDEHFTESTKPIDSDLLRSKVRELNSRLDKMDKIERKVVADAGYGSEHNYEFMEDNNIEAYVKYNYFHKEQKRGWKKNAFAIQNLFYNKDNDFFICPMGQKLTNIGTKKKQIRFILKKNWIATSPI